MLRHRGSLAVAALLWSLASCAPDDPPPAPTLDERVARGSDGPAVIERDDEGEVRAVVGRFEPPASVPGGAEARAEWFLGEYGSAFGIDDPATDARATGTVEGEAGTPEEGVTVVSYERTESGVPVYGAEVKVEVDADGDVIAAVGHVPDVRGVPTTPRISPEDAETIALSAYPGATAFAPPALVVFDEGLFTGVETASVLAWMIRVDAGVLRRPTRFVDATTAALLPYESARVVYARDRHTYSGHLDCDMSRWGEVLTEAGPVPGAMVTPDATSAHDMARTIWDYYWTTFHRDSHDGRGAPMVMFTDVRVEDPATAMCAAFTNAGWSADEQRMYFGEGFVALDVFGHEYTHGVVGATAKLEYTGEPGALNESMADVFGAFIDTATPWTIADTIAGGPYRDLSMPEAHDQPAHVDEQLRFPPSSGTCATDADCSGTASRGCAGAAAGDYVTVFRCESGRCRPTSGDGNDALGVHCNSGIPSHAAYLATAGGTGPHGDVDVSGIGQEKAQQIWFRALTWYMTAATDFMGAKIATRLAAYRFAQRSMHGVTYMDCGSVLSAWGAVGVGSPDGDLDCFTDAVDNCPTVYNPDQARVDCPAPTCSGRGGPCEGSGAEHDGECCDDLICVVRGCTDGMCGRERAACTDASACCRGLACRPVGAADAEPSCCARADDPCASKEDCCGLMECVGGTCRGRASGESCVNGDCAGTSFCNAGTCS